MLLVECLVKKGAGSHILEGTSNKTYVTTGSGIRRRTAQSSLDKTHRKRLQGNIVSKTHTIDSVGVLT